MCGIFGYIGKSESLPFVLEGLKRLEYRGYDSAGIATIEKNRISVTKCSGKISDLEKLLKKTRHKAKIGIGHTRWATHGRPSKENSHPHLDCKGKITVIHNGIIENYLEIRRKLSKEGHVFRSTTDTEVVSHLIEKYLKGDLKTAVRKALKEVEGSYAIAVMYSKNPTKLVVARQGSPLIIGIGEDEAFISSDIPALLKYTGKVMHLNDGEIGVVRRNKIEIVDMNGNPVKKETIFVSWDPVSAEKNGYSHFMLKEINEQPKALRDTIINRIRSSFEIHFDELDLKKKEIEKINRIVFTACGTSWHAGLVGEYLVEQFVRIPAEVEYAAELRYRHPIMDKNTLVVAISQSGETADTLGAIKEAKSLGAKVISICNVVGSSVARESDGVIYTHAGPEIGVASTKAFTSQLALLYLLSVYLGRIKGVLKKKDAKELLQDLLEIPHKLELILAKEKLVDVMSKKYYRCTNALYLGRGKGFPVALEGALKLKEVSYIHAEGYAAAEMKHGPIALIDENMPVIFLALKGRRYEKILGNIEEVKARGGRVIIVALDGDSNVKGIAEDVIYIPETSEALTPILAVVPLQLFAYYIAVRRGCHVDQPRNLAKSVTVE